VLVTGGTGRIGHATMGMPAYMTSTVFDLTGSKPRSFRRWVADHATAFMEGPTA
jgi:hypothetical protein